MRGPAGGTPRLGVAAVSLLGTCCKGGLQGTAALGCPVSLATTCPRQGTSIQG